MAHLGCLDKAFQLVDLAAEAGADVVKFQAYDTNSLYHKTEEEWHTRMKQKEVSDQFLRAIYDYTKSKCLDFALTPHTLSKLPLALDLDPPFIKVGSGEVGNFIHHRALKTTGKHLIISTGMHTEHDSQWLADFYADYNPGITLLHCTTSYPHQSLPVTSKPYLL